MKLAPVLPALPARVSPDVRLRRVHARSDLLPALGVRIAPTGDGQVNITLPANMAEMFLVDLEHRAKEWEAAMRKARIEEIRHQVALDLASGEALRACAAEQDGWAEEYERLRAQGKGHREALNLIRGPKEREALTVTSIELGVQEAQGRRKRRQRAARNAEIVRLASEGHSRQEIADLLGIAYITVRLALKKAGVAVSDARHRKGG